MAANIELNKKQELVVTGALNFVNIPKLEEIGRNLLIAHKNPIFDLKKVDANISDNSALALLLSWARCAKENNKEIVFKNLPAKLLSLIKLGGLENVLPIR
jgi:ABC-type transporter Mla MlaB component